jgi:beta-mannosidase
MDRISLDGAWQAARAGTEDWFAADVPGCVHTALLAAGRIEDPFFRDNEDRLQWITEAGWVYRRDFDVPAGVLGRERVALCCEGLDTLATVALNGRELGRTENMFRSWEFDVKGLLRERGNNLELRFDSPLPWLAERERVRHLPDWHGPGEVDGRAWLRKEPCSFGWDWGPRLASCGPWKSVAVLAWDTARIADVLVRQDHSRPGEVGLAVTVGLERADPADPVGPALEVEVTVRREGRPTVRAAAPVAADGRALADLGIADPELWWPNGLGGQPLYDLGVELRVRDGGAALDSTARRIGLRTLRLDRHPDQWGESFQFVANGVPFFAKGANWIPADAFVTRVSRDDYRRLVDDAADANMNMLRLWGGGIWEREEFYEACDERGICLWHDVPFACSTYPGFDESFLASVRTEAEQNLRRVRHHASIALWCGNNELEQGLVADSWNDRSMSWEDYGRLFDRLLPDVVRRLDPDRDYWPSSPHTPVGDRKNFNDPASGDAHLWSVWHGRQPFEWYRTCTHRFNSEFGFQSFPEPRTVRGYTEAADRNVTSWVMERHQRSGIGNTVIMQYLLDWFRMPTSFDATLRLSQILQAMAMKYACEHWRRSMPRGMGTLYWQLNDCWPVASWSSIDSHGRWKALHHLARRFFAPVLVSGVEDPASGSVEVHVTNDRREDAAGEVVWELTTAAGDPLDAGRIPAAVARGTSRRVGTLELKRHLDTRGPRDLVVWLRLQRDGIEISSNLVLFARPKHLELSDPGIRARATRDADGFLVELTAARPALWAWIELEDVDARCSDNFLSLGAGRPVRVRVQPARRMSLREFRRRLKVASLIDTYA